MNQYKKTIGQMAKIFFLFTSFTVLFYSGILWVQHEYEKKHRYDEPEGAAVKVNLTFEEERTHLERLLLFYLDGE
ncbi:hypothetical protein JOC78_000995 [Bacillus ectoiniformans]|uniref:YqzK family protein n=1 Tax=Bacillus ectoiniformans TaxID=1494429 RepID=UPI003084412C|nr:hypothetical protein [Bacillus ectoiniformans]